MKHILTGLLLATLFPTVHAQDVIPLPNSYIQQDGAFVIGKSLSFPATVSDELVKLVTLAHGIETNKEGKDVKITIDPTLAKEEYKLSVKPKGIEISGGTKAGVFYAVQTLSQMIEHKNGAITIPSCVISDAPRFGWRGLMLDESRHFFGKEAVKHLLDTMAAHKMNKFHWHLTDNEGWRIEIKAYPKLTEIGAWHGEGTKMDTPDRDKAEKDGPNKPRYGGFYTQEDIKEIVAYAAARHIEILPEIDVPGHALAICAAYPEMRPKADGDEGKDVQGLKGNVLSVVREENYVILDKVFGEIAALFPTQYIHVGGDEVNHNAWKNSPEHRAFMKEKGMKHVGQLQNYFMLRLEKILKNHGKTLMGWNEIMHGGNLSNDTGIMAWISVNAGLHAARKGHPTIMTPGPHTYFDMKYPGHSETGHWWAGVVDTKRAYEWNPLFTDQLKPSEQKFIKGVHCCLWTEFVLKPEDVDYKLWPRACATAEVGWTKQGKRKWSEFDQRLGKHLGYLDKLKVQYRVQPPAAVIARGEVKLIPANTNTKAVYTLDGSEPTATSSAYSGQVFPESDLAKLRYRTVRPNGRMSKIEKGAKRLPVGNWAKESLKANQVNVLTFPVSMDKSGAWYADIKSTRGKEPIELTQVRLLADGKEIINVKPSKSELKRGRNLRIKLPISKLDPAAKYSLEVSLKTAKDINQNGVIVFDRSPYKQPSAVASSAIPHYGDKVVTNLTDYNGNTSFWSSRGVKKGELVEIIFDKPVSASEITLPSGKKGTNDDILKSGILEYSTDGKTYQGEVPFQLGPATLKFTKPTMVKSLRIRVTGEQDEWMMLRDPQIK